MEKRILELNKTVPIVRCQNAEVPIESVIGIGAFSLEEVRASILHLILLLIFLFVVLALLEVLASWRAARTA